MRDLVWVDSGPWLRRERAACAALAAEIERLDVALEGAAADRRAYANWFDANFGARTARVRELNERARAMEDLCRDVRRMVDLTDRPEPAAYRDVMALRLGREKIAAMKAAGHKTFGAVPPPEIVDLLGVAFDFEFGEEELGPREFAGAYARFVRDFERRAFRGPRPRKRRGPGAGARAEPEEPAPRPAPPPPAGAKCRRLYHRLARKLHPDLNPGQTAGEAERWHEVRRAFEARDVGRLEYLAGRADDPGASDFAGIDSPGRLREIRADLQREIGGRRAKLGATESDEAKDFSRIAGDPARLRARYRAHDRRLRAVELEANERVRRLEFMEEGWRAT